MRLFSKSQGRVVSLFEKRQKYLNLTETKPGLEIDNWAFGDFMYGKLNNKKRIVTPLEVTSIRPFPPPADGFTFALDFVVDAFQEMSQFYSLNIANQRIHGLENLKELVPTKGYMKSIDLYLSHCENLKNTLFQNYLVPNIKNITSFRSFVVEFMKFVQREAPSTPILYSSFILSPLCPMQTTGLAVEVSSEDHNLNNPKYNIIFDQNFNFFSNMAHSYGFMVSRHAPWMFVANLGSSKMHDYVKFYDMPNPNMDKVIDQYFYECKDFDIDLIRKLMYDSYSEFIISDKWRIDLEICNDKTKSKTNLQNLETTEQINRQFSKYDWLDMYLKILLAQRDMKINSVRYRTFFEQCCEIYNLYGFDRALEFAEMRLLKVRQDAYR